MSIGDLWAELKRRRVVRVVVAYAAAVFVVLQVADLVVEPLELPAWVFRFLLLLALIGFPVAIALAWAFDVEGGGVSVTTDDSPRRARQGRWVVASGAAVAVAIGAWYFIGGSEEAAADGVDPGIVAVVPFRVSSASEELAYLREGSLDLLAPHLSGSPRMVDVGTMVSAWKRAVPSEEADLAEGESLELARSLGAGRLVLASIVGSASSLTLTARLLQVPDGTQIGGVTEDGSEGELRGIFERVAAQLLALESGTEAARVQALADVPLDALKAYLEGRQAYRRTAYLDAREAFAHALDVDPSFALAAMGLREAVAMGLDSDRGAQAARALDVLELHRDRLPPRDREYVELRLFQPGGQSRVERVDGPLAELIRRFPDKPEAWYHYADELFHDATIVAADDYATRAKAAFERSLQLDPGLLVSRQHLIWQGAIDGDTSYVLREGADFLELAAGTESASGIRAMMAWSAGDTMQARVIASAIDTASFSRLLSLIASATFAPASIDPQTEDRLLERLRATAVTPGERSQAVGDRYDHLMNAGRIDEAQAELTEYETMQGPQTLNRLGHHLMWDAPEAPARAAAQTIDARYGAGAEPLPYAEGAEEMFTSEIWRLRQGRTDRVDRTVTRLRAAQDDPDPAHGRNALFALTLEASAAHERGATSADSLVAELDRVMGLGPPDYSLPNSELARLLEARGDLAGAARTAQRRSFRSVPPPFLSKTLYEGGRLWDAAEEPARALPLYRHYLALQLRADESLQPRVERVRSRIAGLEAGAQGG